MAVKGYNIQEAQRQAMRSQIHGHYDQRDILLEGDLDEIVSHKTANSEELRARFRFMECPHPHAQLCV